MTNLKTNVSLLKALRTAAATQLTVDEVYRQRVSFILSSLREESGVTRAQVEHVLSEQMGQLNGDSVRANGN